MAGTVFDYKAISDMNYQIQIKPGKYSTVNINRMKKCYKLPGKVKDVKKKTLVTPEREFLDDLDKFLLSRTRFKIRERTA
jgi:hypothetical protein